MYSEGNSFYRLIKYDPKTRSHTVLVKDVHFANGVQLSPAHDFVLFSESARYRVHRYLNTITANYDR